MRFLRTTCSALALIVAVVTTTTILPVAGSPVHQACARHHHACRSGSMNAKCCCGGHSAPTGQPGPVQSRIQVTSDLALQPAAQIGSAILPDGACPERRLHRSPPRTQSVDLPTLFSSLLI